MKRNTIKLVLPIITILCGLLSCNKYLDVKPEGFIDEEEAYRNESTVNARLNNAYISLASSSLYGENMTMSTVEALGQRFNLVEDNKYYQVSKYNYTTAESKNLMEQIWKKAYTTILDVNEFAEGLDKHYQRAGLSETTRDIYKGEAIAIRAFIHFDLLRLFGPVYKTDATNIAIPYNKTTKSGTLKLLTGKEVIEEVLADLKLAEQLLLNDPILKNGPMPGTIVGANNFMRNRNYRFNYYAVKALQARVNLYIDDKPTALLAAKEVIGVSNFFPWTTVQNAVSEKENPDRVYTTEMVFGIQNSNLYARYNDLFSPALTGANILSTNQTRLNEWYENNGNDYRFNPFWVVPSDGSKTYRTFIKYQDIVDKTKVYRFSMPLLRLSEVYLIAAETEPIASQALEYLNKVRNQRGILSLSGTVNMDTEIQKEYRKEFFGEGQLFFYHKRRNLPNIPNGAANTGNIVMSKNTYVVPLPDSETQPRQ